MRKDVVTMRPIERVSRVLEVLLATSHHGFPVVDEIDTSNEDEIPEYGHLKGLILKSQLITLLQQRVSFVVVLQKIVSSSWNALYFENSVKNL